jgi:hypothetical protein
MLIYGFIQQPDPTHLVSVRAFCQLPNCDLPVVGFPEAYEPSIAGGAEGRVECLGFHDLFVMIERVEVWVPDRTGDSKLERSSREGQNSEKWRVGFHSARAHAAAAGH